ncbi:UNVERIFIED_CONTAM: hypothetical protein Slati_3785200 [Sesamum latifolium]|uniref:Uncharacterized protein n=1 Tax=Sesamum latifolium TaxID=2727402 RepID=A0AAW2U3W7_9LAMI
MDATWQVSCHGPPLIGLLHRALVTGCLGLLLFGLHWAAIRPFIFLGSCPLGPCPSFSPPNSKEEDPWFFLRVGFFVAWSGISPSSCYTGKGQLGSSYNYGKSCARKRGLITVPPHVSRLPGNRPIVRCYWESSPCFGVLFAMASSDKSVRYVGESHPDEDPSKATSKRAGSQSVGPSSGRRRSLRRMVASFRHLIDEEEGEVGGNKGEASSLGEEGRVITDLVVVPSSFTMDWGSSTLQSSHIMQLRREFSIPNSMVTYAPCPDGRAPFPPANSLSFFVAQLRLGLRFPSPSFYREVAHLFQIPLNQLVSNSFRIMASFFMIFYFNEYPVSAQVISQCFRLKRAKPGFFLFTPRSGVSILPVPNPQKNWKKGFFFVLSSWPWGFPDQWIEEPPPSIVVRERDASLLSFLILLNERPYDCRALIDERLLGHFSLSPQVEPLEEPLEYAAGENGGGAPSSHSPKGTPASSGSKGKKPMPPPRGVTSEGPAKRTRASSLGTPPIGSSKPSATPPPPPPIKEEKGVSSWPSRSSSGLGVVIPEDRRLLAPLPRENLERKVALYLMKGISVCGTLFSRYQRVPPALSSDTPSKKLEEKVKRLEKENAQFKEAKKDAASQRSQMEKELKRLSKEGEENEALRKAVEKVVRDYSYSDEGKGFLKAYWASKVDEFKKSDEYQQKVAKIAIPFLEYGFNACKDQFMAQGYPPSGEEPSFVDVKTALF